MPSLELLDEESRDPSLARSEESLQNMARLLELRLRDFNIEGEVVGVLPGPVVTRFELQPAPGVKVQKITALVKDLARSLAVISVRVVEVIPGKSVVGIEIPNEHREMVRLKELLRDDSFSRRRLRSPWRWAKTSPATAWWPTSHACRTCWWQAPPVPVSRWA